ncbi:MAG: hypothetical protein ACREB8_02100 [Pseudolabrys sp.]
MTWWPGWGSVDSAGFWSHFWFWVGIVSLIAVGASAVISHLYGLRKDQLMSAQVAALAARQTAEPAAEQNKVEQGNTGVAEPYKAAPPRVLTLQQQRSLIAALSPFAGQKVRIDIVAGGDDGLARDFVEVFHAARWDVDPASPSQLVLATRLFGLQPTINRAGSVPAAFAALVDALAKLGLGRQTGFADEKTPIGTIALKIGIGSSPIEK